MRDDNAFRGVAPHGSAEHQRLLVLVVEDHQIRHAERLALDVDVLLHKGIIRDVLDVGIPLEEISEIGDPGQRGVAPLDLGRDVVAHHLIRVGNDEVVAGPARLEQRERLAHEVFPRPKGTRIVVIGLDLEPLYRRGGIAKNAVIPAVARNLDHVPGKGRVLDTFEEVYIGRADIWRKEPGNCESLSTHQTPASALVASGQISRGYALHFRRNGSAVRSEGSQQSL